jgi:uncharacterized membrane protein
MTQALAAPSRRPALREPSETAPTVAIVGRRLWFDAIITPSRSLSGRGLTIAGAALALPAAVFATLLARAGFALPALFLGVEAAVVVCLIAWKSHQLGRAEERVLLTDEALVVIASDDPETPPSIRRLEPTWARVERTHHPAVGCDALYVVARGQRITLAAALSPDERESFADALEQALARRRRDISRVAA